jgi:hypothetical protein
VDPRKSWPVAHPLPDCELLTATAETDRPEPRETAGTE